MQRENKRCCDNKFLTRTAVTEVSLFGSPYLPTHGCYPPEPPSRNVSLLTHHAGKTSSGTLGRSGLRVLFIATPGINIAPKVTVTYFSDCAGLPDRETWLAYLRCCLMKRNQAARNLGLCFLSLFLSHVG